MNLIVELSVREWVWVWLSVCECVCVCVCVCVCLCVCVCVSRTLDRSGASEYERGVGCRV